MSGLTRRSFTIALTGAVAGGRLSAASQKVCVFSKHLQFLAGPALAEAVAKMGFDGVDLTVRSGGHVEPARAADDLPPLVRACHEQSLEVPMVTAGIVDASSPLAEAILQTISGLGIRRYRWGGFRWDERPVEQQFDDLRRRISGLAQLNRRYGVCAMYHTHSGPEVGASIWDLYILLRDFDPAEVSINFDIGHATVEGGLGGWIHSLRAVAPYSRGLAIKDFLWKKLADGRWDAAWCPLGEGMVAFPAFFERLKRTKFDGPMQLHFEYPLGGAENGARTLTIPQDRVFAAMRRDLARLRGFLNAG